MSTECVIEDMLTCQKLHGSGWRTYYDPTSLAYGIAPDDAISFHTQRLRWAQGAMQILRSRSNPLLVRGLSFGQRISYFSSVSVYFDAHVRFLLIFLPVIVVMSGLRPIDTDPRIYFGLFTPYFVASMTLAVWNQHGWHSLLRQERFTLAKMLISIRASLTLVTGSRSLGFAVTPKTATGGGSPDAYVLAALSALSGLTTLIGVAGLLGIGPAGGFPTWLIAGSVFWALVNTLLLAATVPVLSGRKLFRGTYRFPWRIPIALRSRGTGRSHVGSTLDISWNGLALVADFAIGDTLDVVLQPVGTTPIRLTGVVRSRVGEPARLGLDVDGSERAELDRLIVAITTGGARDQNSAEARYWGESDRAVAAA
jgi:hypothetical protein